MSTRRTVATPGSSGGRDQHTKSYNRTPQLKAEQTKKRIQRFFFLDEERVRFVPVRADVRDGLTALGLGSSEFATWLALYSAAVESAVHDEGPCVRELELVTSLPMLAGLRGVGPRTALNHLVTLERLGLLHRSTVAGGQILLRLPSMRSVLGTLYATPGVLEGMTRMQPRRYRQRDLARLRDRAAEEAKCECASRPLIHGHAGETSALDAGANSDGQLRDFGDLVPREHESQSAPPEEQVPDSDVAALLATLAEGIRSRLGSSFKLRPSDRDYKMMAELLSTYHRQQLERVIAYATEPDKWHAFRTRFRLTAVLPLPGVLRGYAKELVPLALDGFGEMGRRSGGAEWYPRSTVDEDGHETF